MDDKDKKSKSVCTPFDEETYKALKIKAGNAQSVASVVRIAVMKYLAETEEKTIPVAVHSTTPQAMPTITAMDSQAPTPEKKITGEKPVVSPLIIAKYDTGTDSAFPVYGPPTACPVCLKAHGELGDRALQIVNSGPDKGAWACYECFSSGRWSNDKEVQILKNTQSATSGEGDTLSPVKE